MAGFAWQGSSKLAVEMAGFAKRKYAYRPAIEPKLAGYPPPGPTFVV